VTKDRVDRAEESTVPTETTGEEVDDDEDDGEEDEEEEDDGLDPEDHARCVEAFQTVDVDKSGKLLFDQVLEAFEYIEMPLSSERQTAVKKLLEEHQIEAVSLDEWIDLVILVSKDMQEANGEDAASQQEEAEETEEGPADARSERLQKICDDCFWLTDEELQSFGEMFRKLSGGEDVMSFDLLIDLMREMNEPMSEAQMEEVHQVKKETPQTDIVEALEMYAARRLHSLADLSATVVDQIRTLFDKGQPTGEEMANLCAKLGYPVREEDMPELLADAANVRDEDLMLYISRKVLEAKDDQDPAASGEEEEAAVISDEDYQSCKDVFDRMCHKKNGNMIIEAAEVAHALRELGIELNDQEARDLERYCAEEKLFEVQLDVFVDIAAQFLRDGREAEEQPAEPAPQPPSPKLRTPPAGTRKPTTGLADSAAWPQDEMDSFTASRLAAMKGDRQSGPKQQVLTTVLQGIALSLLIIIVFYILDSNFRGFVNGMTRGFGFGDAADLDDSLDDWT